MFCFGDFFYPPVVGHSDVEVFRNRLLDCNRYANERFKFSIKAFIRIIVSK